MLADIKKLKDSLPNAERLLQIRPSIDAIYEQKKGVQEKLNVFKAEIEVKEAEIEKVRKELEDAKEVKDDIKQQLDKYETDIQKLKEDLQKHFSKKDELREEYFKNRLEYELENDAIRHAEWIAREKAYLLEREQRKQEKIAARKQALADRPNPFQKELDTCERLIGYCELLKKKLGLTQTEESIKQEQKQIINEMAKEDVQKKLKDGKIEQVKSKREREEESLI